MSQGWVSADDHRWNVTCNVKECKNPTPLEPTRSQRSLYEMANNGWFIAKLFGDACPSCVAKGLAPGDVEPMFPELWSQQQQRGVHEAPITSSAGREVVQ
jgi:hypothetical protein